MDKKPDLRKAFGSAGETKAEGFLLKNGYKILQKNFRCRAGEIDIIARENDTIVFAEVKTRRSDSCGTPEESVHYFKQKKIVNAARYYLHRNNIVNMDCRFDVISVRYKENSPEEIVIIKNAFDAG